MTYEEHHVALVVYLKAKVEAADWHGVSDAANDLRVLEASWQRCTGLTSNIPEVNFRSDGQHGGY